MMDNSRRNLLALAGLAPLALLAGRKSHAGTNACYDPATLPRSQRSRRRSLGYVEVSTDARKRCGLCAFFTASTEGCGKCQMLTGGPVSGKAVCNSFAAKKR